MCADVVWIAGEEELAGADGTYLLGTFRGHHETDPGPPRAQCEGLDADGWSLTLRERIATAASYPAKQPSAPSCWVTWADDFRPWR
jgi:hypothetical protein